MHSIAIVTEDNLPKFHFTAVSGYWFDFPLKMVLHTRVMLVIGLFTMMFCPLFLINWEISLVLRTNSFLHFRILLLNIYIQPEDSVYQVFVSISRKPRKI